jgi:6-phosphogluconolactonase/glucosamine-6-phosphate isomerase/deaminase
MRVPPSGRDVSDRAASEPDDPGARARCCLGDGPAGHFGGFEPNSVAFEPGTGHPTNDMEYAALYIEGHEPHRAVPC